MIDYDKINQALREPLAREHEPRDQAVQPVALIAPSPLPTALLY